MNDPTDPPISSESTDDEQVLGGGVANAGRVVRVGSEVRRPAPPQSRLVQTFLHHLQSVGFGLGPEPLGWDDEGREQLSFIDGDVPGHPYADWVWSEELLTNVACAQRRLHDAAATFGGDPAAGWAESAGAYFPPRAFFAATPLFCHNDLGLSNVVVRDSEVVGFIDFDYVRAVDPLFDIGVTARHWAPLGVPLAREGRPPSLDRVRRFGLFADAHGLSVNDRHRVLDLVIDFLAAAFDNVQALAAAGNTGFETMIDDGYLVANHQSRAWIAANRKRLTS